MPRNKKGKGRRNGNCQQDAVATVASDDPLPPSAAQQPASSIAKRTAHSCIVCKATFKTRPQLRSHCKNATHKQKLVNLMELQNPKGKQLQVEISSEMIKEYMCTTLTVVFGYIWIDETVQATWHPIERLINNESMSLSHWNDIWHAVRDQLLPRAHKVRDEFATGHYTALGGPRVDLEDLNEECRQKFLIERLLHRFQSGFLLWTNNTPKFLCTLVHISPITAKFAIRYPFFLELLTKTYEYNYISEWHRIKWSQDHPVQLHHAQPEPDNDNASAMPSKDRFAEDVTRLEQQEPEIQAAQQSSSAPQPTCMTDQPKFDRFSLEPSEKVTAVRSTSPLAVDAHHVSSNTAHLKSQQKLGDVCTDVVTLDEGELTRNQSATIDHRTDSSKIDNFRAIPTDAGEDAKLNLKTWVAMYAQSYVRMRRLDKDDIPTEDISRLRELAHSSTDTEEIATLQAIKLMWSESFDKARGLISQDWDTDMDAECEQEPFWQSQGPQLHMTQNLDSTTTEAEEAKAEFDFLGGEEVNDACCFSDSGSIDEFLDTY